MPQTARLCVLFDGEANSLSTYDARTGKFIAHLHPAAETGEFAIHPIKPLVATAFQHHFTLWDFETGSPETLSPEHTSTITSITFSAGGGLIATAGFDHLVNLWDVKSRKHLATMVGHRGRIDRVAFCPQGKTLASADRYGLIKLWHVETQQYLCDNEGGIPGASVATLQFSKDGRRLVCLQGGDLRVLSSLISPKVHPVP